MEWLWLVFLLWVLNVIDSSTASIAALLVVWLAGGLG